MKTTENMYGANVGPEDEELPAGFLIEGRYAIDGFLARGGFATVYRAHHVQIERSVAIKVLEPPRRRSGAEGFQQRFLQEAKIAARISHPGVVDVFDFGLLDDGRAYIAMDLLVGHDLERELEVGGPIKASRLIPLIADCLGALHEGHEQGIVHKDLKPSNLFLVRPGTAHERLVILDFGIARVFADPGAKVTREGGFSGTPAYLAPEYIRSQQVSPALDVYQMGLILLEAMTGVPAIHADNSMGYLLAHCLNPIILPKVLHDTELGTVCLKAVEKSPELRWPDAGAFRDALLGVPRLDLFDTEPLDVVPAPSVPGASKDSVETQAKTLQFIEVSHQQFETALQEAAPDGLHAALEAHRSDTVVEQAAVETPAERDGAVTSNQQLVRLASILAGIVVVAAIVVVFALFWVTTSSAPTTPASSAEPTSAVQPSADQPSAEGAVPTGGVAAEAAPLVAAETPTSTGEEDPSPTDGPPERVAEPTGEVAAEPVEQPEVEPDPEDLPDVEPRPRDEARSQKTRPTPEPRPKPNPKSTPTSQSEETVSDVSAEGGKEDTPPKEDSAPLLLSP